MVSFPHRAVIALASAIVPGKLRHEWRQEWEVELGFRQRSATSLSDVLRAVRGCFRDAIWVRSRTPFDFTFFLVPLRIESILCALALAAALWSGALVPVKPDYPNLDRLLRLERSRIFLGPIDGRLLRRWQAAASVEQIAPYRTFFAGSGSARLAYVRVQSNFFDVLGVKAWNGRLLTDDDSLNSAVITFAFWRSQFHSDPRAIGASFSSGGRTYIVKGILGPTFGFHRGSYFAPLGFVAAPEAIALLKPGFTREAAEAELLQIVRQSLPGRSTEGFRLQPLVSRVAVSSLLLALLVVLLPLTYLFMRRRWMKAYAGARIAVTLAAVVMLNIATARPVNRIFPILSIIQVWVFLAFCAAAVYLILRDHRSRCPQCLAHLKMPVAIGTWGSLLIDPPQTEYVCPHGHGALSVSDAMHDPDRWTVFDESWKDLFASPPR